MTKDEFREAGKETTDKKGSATGTASGATPPARAPAISAPVPRGPAPPAPRGPMMVPSGPKPPFGLPQAQPHNAAPQKKITPLQAPDKKDEDSDTEI